MIRVLDIDALCSANLLVKRHGRDAPIQAAMRADAMLAIEGKGTLPEAGSERAFYAR